MKALLPQPGQSVNLLDAYAIPPGDVGGRPFVRCNMISSLDGAVSVHGRSGALGGPADHRVFQVLRSLADVVVVGAGTARAEQYGPARLEDDLQEERRRRGQPPLPPIAVVTRSGNLDWSAPFFLGAAERPIVFMAQDSDPSARRRGADVAHVVVAGVDRVDPVAVLDHFHGVGYRSVLLEGGPGLNADFVHEALVDEFCLTVSPRLVAGDGPRVLAGPELRRPLELELVHLLEENGFLFCRLRVASLLTS